MPRRFANNAVATLASGITAGQIYLDVTAGQGTRFPEVGTRDWVLATLDDGTNVEVLRVTAHSYSPQPDNFIIERAVEAVAGSATAYAFGAGTKFQIRVTDAALEAFAHVAPWVDRLNATGVGGSPRFLAYGNGDPATATRALDMGSQAGPTPTNVGTGTVRLVKFTMAARLTVSALRIFYTATGVNVFSFAVYTSSLGQPSAKVFNTGLLTAPAANTWGNFAVAGSPVLEAGDEYWLAMGVSATGTTSPFRSWPQPVNAAVFGAANSPLADIAGVPAMLQATVTIGATPTWPNPITNLAAAAFVNGTTGTIPAVLLEGTIG